MFSGIVEVTSRVKNAQSCEGMIQLTLEKPNIFNDLSVGDSVAVNGVCLTVENFDDETMEFAVAAETLQVTGWSAQTLLSSQMNLERSLKLGDRIHGHMVAGHVDAMGRVLDIVNIGQSLQLSIEFPKSLQPMVWKKGSVAINGVSLTINSVEHSSESPTLTVCLVPETLRRTNLGDLQTGSLVTLEADMWARGFVHWLKINEVKERGCP